MKKVDKSLEEVLDMKERVYEDFVKSGYSSIIDFIKDETKEFKKIYKIKNRQERIKEVDRLVKS